VDTLGAAMPNRAVSFDILGAANTGAIREEQPGVYAVDVFSYQISNVNVEPKLDDLQVGSFNADIAFVQAPVVTAVMDSTRSAKNVDNCTEHHPGRQDHTSPNYPPDC
jgi:hypothetical protein